VVLDLLQTRRVDCLVSEIEMVPIGGFELLSMARSADPTLPVILVADTDSEVTKQDALSAGATDYLELGDNQQYSALAAGLEDAIDNRTSEIVATDGGYTDLSTPLVPLQQLVDAETNCEIVTLVDSVVSEHPSVSESSIWLFDSHNERLERAGYDADDTYRSPPAMVADAFETGQPQISGKGWTTNTADTADTIDTDDITDITDVVDRARSAESIPESTAEDTDSELQVVHPLEGVGAISVCVDTVTPTVQKTLSQLSTIAGACLEHNREYARIEQRLHQVADRNQTLSQFAQTVAHDLNSPLSVIYGRIELSLAEPSEADIHLQAALNAAQRVDSLITDHLQTIETVDAESETEVVSVQTVATDAWRIIDPSTARLQIEPQLKTVQANAIRLQQLFENLIRNAIEHGSEESVGLAASGDDSADSVFDEDINTVTVTIKPTATGFAVCDDGPGIPESERTNVFESGYTTTESGSGLGLHIVSEITAAHDWEISISESESGGARFDIDTR
jgi:signal transduction histidine kinase